MVRIRIPNGLLQAHQLRTIAEITERYARGNADLTVRQNIQLHWVTIEALPEVLDSLWRAGLTTKGSCGDDTRNITGCPLAGVDAEEIFDASALALEANRFFVGNAEFYNLPESSRFALRGAARGALIRRLMTLDSRLSPAGCVVKMKLGSRSGRADFQLILILQPGSTHFVRQSARLSRFCVASRRCSVTAMSSARIANAPA